MILLGREKKQSIVCEEMGRKPRQPGKVKTHTHMPEMED